jgi:multiple sugar transport system substrate-binding protein
VKRIKRVTAGALVAAVTVCGFAVVAFGGTASAAKPKVVHLSFWSWVPDINLAVNLWNQSHPTIQVKLDTIPGGSVGGYAKMYAAASAHNAPDIGQIEYAFLPNFVQVGDIANIGPYVSKATVKDFAPGIWGQVSSGKKVYAIPQDFAPMVFYYNKAAFAADGITTPPATWAEFATDAATIHSKNATQYISNFPTNEPDWLAGLDWQDGGKWFSYSGGKWHVTITDAADETVANYWQTLINNGSVEATGFWSDAWDKQFQDKSLLGWFGGAWGDSSIESATTGIGTGDWAIAAMPQWTAGQNNTGDWGGSTNAVFKDSKHPAQAAEFAAWLNTNPASENSLAAKSGLYMAATNWYKTSSFATTSSFFGGAEVYQLASTEKFPTGWAWGPVMTSVFTAMSNSTAGLGTGSGSSTVAQALAAGQSGAVSALQQSGFPVAG